MADTKRARRERLTKICGSLPEAVSTTHQGQHWRFAVRDRTFGWYVDNEHGDGRVALCCKVPPGEQQPMIASGPERYYYPKYMGPRGWVCLRLDLKTVDWDEVEDLVHDSYRLVAPKRLAALAER